MRVTTAVVRTVSAGLACALLLATGATPAAAEDAAAARDQARAAAAQVQVLALQLTRAQEAYDQALTDIGQSTTDSVLATAQREADALAARRAVDDRVNVARRLYMSGGPGALLSSLLSARDTGDLAGRAVSADRLLRSVGVTALEAQRTSEAATRRAHEASAAADASVVTAGLVQERAAAVTLLLAQGQRRLGALSARARARTEAEAAARALAEARAAAARSAAAATAAAAARLATGAAAPPAAYGALYRAAALTCPGMSWTLLAAVGQVESGHGRNNGPSSAGAVGPMQFMPATFAAFAVDGDRDGRTDPWSPADAVYTAARYLCTGGAGRPDGVQAALLRYNHAQWYVDLVLGVQQGLLAQGDAALR